MCMLYCVVFPCLSCHSLGFVLLWLALCGMRVVASARPAGSSWTVVGYNSVLLCIVLSPASSPRGGSELAVGSGRPTACSDGRVPKNKKVFLSAAEVIEALQRGGHNAVFLHVGLGVVPERREDGIIDRTVFDVLHGSRHKMRDIHARTRERVGRLGDSSEGDWRRDALIVARRQRVVACTYWSVGLRRARWRGRSEFDCRLLADNRLIQ